MNLLNRNVVGLEKIPVTHKIANLEIITMLLNSVAKKYGCRVEYLVEENRLKFYGDRECCRHVTEETLAFFPMSDGEEGIPLDCSLN